MAKLPSFIKIGNEIHKPIVLLVNTKDKFGRPKLCTIFHEEEKMELAGGEEFIIAYAKKRVMAKKKNV